MEAMVVLKRRANVDTAVVAKVPGVSAGNFVVDNSWAANGAKWCGIKVEGAIRVLPGGDIGHYGGSVEKV